MLKTHEHTGDFKAFCSRAPMGRAHASHSEAATTSGARCV